MLCEAGSVQTRVLALLAILARFNEGVFSRIRYDLHRRVDMGLGGKPGRTSDIQVPLRNVAINPNGGTDLRLSAGAGSVVRFCRALRALGVLPPRLLESAWQARSALRWAEDIHDGPNRMVSSFNSCCLLSVRLSDVRLDVRPARPLRLRTRHLR